MVTFITGNPPYYDAETEYEILGWGEQSSPAQDGKVSTYVFFRSGGTVLSTPIENAKESPEKLFRHLTANYPKYNVRIE